MKRLKSQYKKVYATVAGVAATGMAHAQTGPTVPTELTDLLADGGTLALAVVGLGIGAYGVWRGGLIAFNVAKRMLSKAGL